MSNDLDPAALFPGEDRVSGAGFPFLQLGQSGEAEKPLMLFVPGGGHLARIFYGHPGAVPEDFLLTHLWRAGFSCLALSYPTSHPCLGHPFPGMSIKEWSAACAELTAAHIGSKGLGKRVVALGWSLGGRIARNLATDLRHHGISLELFIGLSAAPPLPGFGALARSALKLAPSGLRDDSSADSSIYRSRDAQLAVIDGINGRTIIPRDVYARHYVADSPINFRGEAERYQNHDLVTDVAEAVADQGSFDFAGYPLCAAIAAGGPSDARFALTSASVFGMLNAQSLYFQVIKPALDQQKIDPATWEALRALMDTLTPRLSRHVDGSHFFFVGQTGAQATAQYVQNLVAAAALLRRELAAVLG